MPHHDGEDHELRAAERADPARVLVLITMCLGVLVAQIDTSVVNLALKHIGTDLARRQPAAMGGRRLQSFLCEPADDRRRAGDLYGRRRIFALGIALFTLGSLVCGFAPDIGTLIAGRAIAGIGAALEVPATLAILTVACAGRARTRLAAWHLGELQRPCLHHRPDARRRPGRPGRLAQHLPADRAALRARADAGAARAGIGRAAGRRLDLPGPGARDSVARRAVAHDDRGPALGLDLPSLSAAAIGVLSRRLFSSASRHVGAASDAPARPVPQPRSRRALPSPRR